MFEDYPYPAPWPHQVRGAEAIVARRRPEGVLLPHDVGWGKSLTVAAAAYELYRTRQIDTVLVIAPAYARSVWSDPDPVLGEFAKWPLVPLELTEYCAASPALPAACNRLQVVVSNYEFVRRENRMDTLIDWLDDGRATLLVVDESWMCYDALAQQTKAVKAIARSCDRMVLLNGTPGKPEQLYGQITTINATAYPVRNKFHYLARYCRMGGYERRKIVGYQEEHQAERIAVETRYIVPVLESDVVDLPELMPPALIEAQLTTKTWDIYRQMRDEFVAEIDIGTIATAMSAGVKHMRLQQILAGFVGGVEGCDDQDVMTAVSKYVVVGDEKLKAAQTWLDGNNPNKAMLWGRFRPEMARVADALRQSNERVFMLWGKQDSPQRDHDDERRRLKLTLAPGSPDGARVRVVGHPAAGGAGLNFSGASVGLWLSAAQSRRVRKQADGRIQRPGQTRRAQFVDVIAVGPQGQKTVDHSTAAALKAEDEWADWTAAQWRAAVAVE